MTCKYEKVTDMTVGQVVDAIIDGKRFYYYQGLDSYELLTLDLMNLKLGVNNIYTHHDKQWWENIKKGVICWVWDNNSLGETIRCIVKVRQDDIYKFVDYAGDVFEFARPLTQTEKALIMVKKHDPNNYKTKILAGDYAG
jgi:hypothetical protein